MIQPRTEHADLQTGLFFVSSTVFSRPADHLPELSAVRYFRYFYLFATQLHYLKMLKEKKKCRKRWRGGLKETIELILIRPPQLQFFEDGIKITATGTV